MPAMSARLFAALDLPAAARAGLAGWVAGFVDDAPESGGGASVAGSAGVGGTSAASKPGGREPSLAPASGGAAASELQLRAVAPEALHVTLCFLGAQPLEAAAAIGTAVVAAATAAGRAHGLALGAPLWLPRRRPNVLAVTIADGAGELGALQAAVADALVAGGWFTPERRPLLPHVTVARVRGGSRGLDARAVARRELPAPPALAFHGAAVTLYRSHLGRGGSRYEALARARLQ
jgi:2'-5' RNA ligase